MSVIDTVISCSKQLESKLETEFQAEGRGLHSKLSNVECLLPVEVAKKIRWLATIRNKVVHEADFYFEDTEAYKRATDEVISLLRNAPQKRLNDISITKESTQSTQIDLPPNKFNQMLWGRVENTLALLIMAFIFFVGFTLQNPYIICGSIALVAIYADFWFVNIF